MLAAKKVNCYIYCFVKDPSIRWKFDVQNGNSAMQKQQQQQQQLHYKDLQVKVFFETILTSFQIFFQIIEIRSVEILLEERTNTEAAQKKVWDFDAFGDLQ